MISYSIKPTQAKAREVIITEGGQAYKVLVPNAIFGSGADIGGYVLTMRAKWRTG